MDHNHDHSHHSEHNMAQPAHAMDHSSHHGSNASGHEMSMYFHANSHATILFSFWTTSSPLAMAWSCAIIVILGILYEGLKSLREHLMAKESTCSKANGTIPTISQFDDHKVEFPSKCCGAAKQSMTSSKHFLQTSLHGLQVFYSYCLMLIFMTYNIWLCTSVVIGAIIGYFFFSWRRHSCKGCNPGRSYALSEQCH